MYIVCKNALLELIQFFEKRSDKGVQILCGFGTRCKTERQQIISDVSAYQTVQRKEYLSVEGKFRLITRKGQTS